VPLVIFDLDNTLVDRSGAFRRWAAEFVADHGLDPAEAGWLAAADGDGFAPRLGFVSAVRERYGMDQPVDAMLERYRERTVAYTEPYPQVPAMLDQLRAAGWQVAIATNGHVAQQSAKINGAALAVDAIAISEEVGDCTTRDIAGGRGAGLRTIWMRHGRSWDPASSPPDAIVDEIREAVTVLADRPG
jgi:FMN phosphatase YigB (HAD superfamily)